MSVYCIPIINLKKMLLRKIHLQFLLKKKMHISGPAHYKPMLFRGHLYFLHHVSVSPSTSGRFITVLLNLKHHSLLDSAHFYNLYTHSHVNTIIPYFYNFFKKTAFMEYCDIPMTVKLNVAFHIMKREILIIPKTLFLFSSRLL